MIVSRSHVKPYIRTYFLFLCIGLFTLPLLAEDKKTYRLTMAKGEPVHEMALSVLQEAYARLGLRVEVVYSPWKRSLAENERGKYDGEIGRHIIVERSTKNLIRVDEPLFNLAHYAYALEPIPEVREWADLKNLKVGVELGVLIVESGSQGLSRVFAHDKKALAMLLRRGAVDVAIMEDIFDYRTAPYNFHRSPVPLEHQPLYHYLHKSHTAAAEAVRLELLAMRRMGNIFEITGRFH